MAFWSKMVTASFACLDIKLVGVTVGEALKKVGVSSALSRVLADIHSQAISLAIRLAFHRILFFCILSVFLPGMLVPNNSLELLFANKGHKSSSSASASPFVVAIKLSSTKHLELMYSAFRLFDIEFRFAHHVKDHLRVCKGGRGATYSYQD
jgi:amino acid transporter